MTGMGGDLHFADSHGGTHDFRGGVNYLNVETLEVMLGRGNDTLAVNGWMTSTDGTAAR